LTALVIDEAQSLPHDLLEEVRLLANFETATDKLLPVVLAGQPELAARLENEELRQLKQRVALRCDLSALSIRETAAYIAGRVAIAGGDSAGIFTRGAVQTIYERSRGIPRTISVICDNSLLTGFAAGVKPVDSDLVLEVCRDFRLPQFKLIELSLAREPVPASAQATTSMALGVAAPTNGNGTDSASTDAPTSPPPDDEARDGHGSGGDPPVAAPGAGMFSRFKKKWW